MAVGNTLEGVGVGIAVDDTVFGNLHKMCSHIIIIKKLNSIMLDHKIMNT